MTDSNGNKNELIPTPEERALTAQYKHESLMMAREALKDVDDLFLNVVLFEHAQRVGTMLAKSTMVPKDYQENIGNCMIALNYSKRLKVDVFMLMQNMYIIGGNPGIEAKLVIALINNSGLYEDPLEWEFSGERGTDGWSCTAFATRKETNKLHKQTIDLKTVKSMGWYNKKGPAGPSMWQTMPEQMFKYRTASWFCNSYCPEVKMGLHTVEELREMAAPIVLEKDASETFKQIDAPPPGELYKTTTKETPGPGPDLSKPVTQEQIDKVKEVLAKETPPAEDTETGEWARHRYIGLRSSANPKAGLKGYILKHSGTFFDQPGEKQEDVRAKFHKLYGSEEPFPIDMCLACQGVVFVGKEAEHQAECPATVGQEPTVPDLDEGYASELSFFIEELGREACEKAAMDITGKELDSLNEDEVGLVMRDLTTLLDERHQEQDNDDTPSSSDGEGPERDPDDPGAYPKTF